MNSQKPLQQNGIIVPSSDVELFDSFFKELTEVLSMGSLKAPEISDAIAWFKKVNEYNVPHGKKNRGLSVLHSYRTLAGNKVTLDDIKLACILGWCIEWLQAFFLVADDIMDSSATRRGQPCWYKMPGVDHIAINDCLYLESAVYVILKKYFSRKSYYVEIIELFHETTFQTVIGENLDLCTTPKGRVDFTYFTLDRYRTIAKWKTAFYSIYLPVACAMYMVGIDDAESHANAKTILLQLGEFAQIQDDYEDCYGDPSVTGKIGTDIENNKCGWLVVQALLRATPEQRQLLQENYGQKGAKQIAKVKALYNKMDMKGVFAAYEEESYKELIQLIDDLSGDLPKDIFMAFAKKIYKG